MASAAITAAGSKIFVSATAPATYDEAGFLALTWTEVGEVTEVPEFGKSYTVVTHNPLGERQTIKRKGSYDNGEITCPYAYDPDDDAGQVILRAAENSDSSYSFRVDIKNPAVKTVYFSAQVIANTLNIGGTDNIVMGSAGLAIDGDVLIEDAFA